MGTRVRYFISTAAAFLLAGCMVNSAPARDAGPDAGGDAGGFDHADDGAATVRDVGPTRDAGGTPDAKSADLSGVDAGDPTDAGDGADQDAALPLPSPFIEFSDPVEVTEGGPDAATTVRLLRRPSAPVALTPVTHPDASATAVTISPQDWEEWHTVTVSAIDDATAEISEVHELRFDATSSDGTYDGEFATLSATVHDDETAEVLIVDVTGGAHEDEGNTSVAIRLSAPPELDVVVEPAANFVSTVHPLSPYVVPTGLVFTSTNWDQPQTAVFGLRHTRYQDEGNGSLTVSVRTEDPAYQQAVLPDPVSLVVWDDDVLIGGAERIDVDPFVFEGAPPSEIRISAGLWPSLVHFRTNLPEDVQITPVQVRVSGPSSTALLTPTDDAIANPPRWVALGVTYVQEDDQNIYFPSSSSRTFVLVDDDAHTMVADRERFELTERRASHACMEVVLSVKPTAPVSIPVSSSDRSAFEADVASVDFDPQTWPDSRRVCVRATDDVLPDGPQHASLEFGVATSNDPDYAGLDPDDIPVEVGDDDSPGFTNYHAAPPVFVEPFHGEVTWPIFVLPNTDGCCPPTFDLSSADPSLPSVDYETFGSWRAPFVRAQDDSVASGTRSVTLSFSNIVNTHPDYAGVVPRSFDVTVLDLDVIHEIERSEDWLFLRNPATFNVVLDSQPTADVAIPIQPSDPSEVAASPATVVFTPTTWSTPVTVTVTSSDGGVFAPRSSWLELGPASSADSRYDGQFAPPIQLTNH